MEIKGKFTNDVKIYAKTLEDDAVAMIQQMADSYTFENIKIRIMPDCHSGAGCCIGTSYKIGDYVNPHHVGVDIGCMMSSIELSTKLKEEDYALFNHKVISSVPTGFYINEKKPYNDKDLFKFLNKEYNKARSNWSEMIDDIGRIDEGYIETLCRKIGIDLNTFYKSIGTLGGGNHFMEYGETDDGRAFFTVHCGSRNLGVKICNYWAKIAEKPQKNSPFYNIDEEIQKVKKTFDKTLWNEKIKEIHEIAKAKNPTGYLYGETLKGYLSDMVIAQAYAKFNHEVILNTVSSILSKFKIKETDRIQSIHNYISFDDHILRKGAISSYIGERMIIPFNMRDGIAICEGKSNDDWNCTAPHGAGRLMSRTEAKKNITVESFKDTMKNVFSTTVCEGTLDEAPQAYKPMDEIVELIKPTADIKFFIKPKINIKAVESEIAPWKKK